MTLLIIYHSVCSNASRLVNMAFFSVAKFFCIYYTDTNVQIPVCFPAMQPVCRILNCKDYITER